MNFYQKRKRNFRSCKILGSDLKDVETRIEELHEQNPMLRS